MDRNTNYPGQVPLETDLLKTNQFAMTGLAKLSAAMLGLSTVTNNLVVSQSVVPAMSVLVQPGEIYSAQNLEATAYSSLPTDTTHTILKQGIALNATTLAIAAPATAGYSINYLVQAAYQDLDSGSTVLPYYNAANPAVAYSGPANSGTAQPTTRAGTVALNAKAGISATTGTQTTPAPDVGYLGIGVITVANGAVSIVNANITPYIGASGLPAGGIVAAVQNNALTNAADTGTANTYVCAYSPAVTTIVDGMVVWFKALTPNTGASTLKLNALAPVTLIGGAHGALQGGEIVANGKCLCVYSASLSAFVLIECTGGALQAAAATKSNHAALFNQIVQAGTGLGQATNVVKIGWSGTRLKATVDAIDQGNFVFDAQAQATYAALAGLSTQTFNVAPATTLAHAAAYSQIVQAGTGIGQSATNVVKIGFSGSRLKATVDSTDLGNFVFDATFGASIAGNGYQRLPSGLIIQWGTGATAGSTTTGTFPIAFPTACFVIQATDQGSGSHAIGMTPTTTGYTMYANIASTNFQWTAIGY